MSLTLFGRIAQCRYYLVCIVLFFVLLGLFLPTYRHIVISTTLADGTPFQCYTSSNYLLLKWRHSVEKQYWQEYYEQHGNQLHLTRTYMQAFGAGTPAIGNSIPAPDGYVGLSSDVLLDEINWMVSSNMQGEIFASKLHLPIYQTVNDYTLVHIQIQQASWVTWLWMDKC